MMIILQIINLLGDLYLDLVYRFWRPALWVDRRSKELFHLDEQTGLVTVEEDGLYYIYAQVSRMDFTISMHR